MSNNLAGSIKEICRERSRDRTRLMDILLDVQRRFGCVSPQAHEIIAREVGIQRAEVASVVTFYAFLSELPKGGVVIRVCNDIVDRLQGADRVARAFSEELGIDVGETTPDGKISLEYTACIGMSDQAPAALVNEVVLTRLSSDRAREIVHELRDHMDPHRLIEKLGDGNNAHDLVGAMVENNMRMTGPVVLAPLAPGSALRKAMALSPVEVIRDLKTARLRGRGGAGFPTGMKWDFVRAANGGDPCVICNADEGEPGTFKDRVILTERPEVMLEGMTIAAYALSASTGIIYLRAEYTYLRAFLENAIEERRSAGLLGTSICGKEGFDFDIRIQMGAGAYICGEETGLISSCEGLRGDPKNRPPFPAQKGYLGRPTTVNNVETFCCVARIIDMGPAWFSQMGSKGSTGTKLLSISGDCKSPGVYEVPFGISLRELLDLAGGSEAAAVQMGGPSGQMVAPTDYDRIICYDDLATGGSLIVFRADRDLLEIVDAFLEFFVEESCGYCTPCRVGNLLLKKKLEDILVGKGEATDLDYLRDLGESIKATSRCGLGQTSPNPVLTSLERFRPVYQKRLATGQNGKQRSFDIRQAVALAEEIAGRDSEIFPNR